MQSVISIGYVHKQLTGIGYIDDLTVIVIAIRFSYTDIEDFKKWPQEQEQKDSEKEESQLDDVK